MKKMMSLAAMCAVLAYASPASAELKLGGDASIRMRSETYSGPSANTPDVTSGMSYKQANDLKWQYRVRLNASADLGDGYFFKAMLTDETPDAWYSYNYLNGYSFNARTQPVPAGGWRTLGYGNTETFTLNVSNFYFGRMMDNCHYMVGRLPLNSFNNPIFDLALYPTQPLENPVTNINMDRVYGGNYGMKLGDGEANATLVVLDDSSKGSAMLNDGYAMLLSYKTTIGKVTVEPEYLRVLTNSDIWSQTVSSATLTNTLYGGVTPYAFGANLSTPVWGGKLGISGIYTKCNDTTPSTAPYGATGGSQVNYSGYEFRIKGEFGNFMAFYDYNRTTDKSKGSASYVTGSAYDFSVNNAKYTNHFVWAQYKVPVYSSAKGTFTVQPTLRYLASKKEIGTGLAGGTNLQRLRSELWATVTF